MFEFQKARHNRSRCLNKNMVDCPHKNLPTFFQNLELRHGTANMQWYWFSKINSKIKPYTYQMGWTSVEFIDYKNMIIRRYHNK